MYVRQCHDMVRLVQEVINIDRWLRFCPHIKFVLVSQSGAHQLRKLITRLQHQWLVTYPCHLASEVVREEAVHLFAPKYPEESGKNQESRLILCIMDMQIPAQETFNNPQCNISDPVFVVWRVQIRRESGINWNQRRHSHKDREDILLKILFHMKYVGLCRLREVTSCLTIRLLNKGAPIDVLGQHLGLRHVEYMNT